MFLGAAADSCASVTKRRAANGGLKLALPTLRNNYLVEKTETLGVSVTRPKKSKNDVCLLCISLLWSNISYYVYCIIR